MIKIAFLFPGQGSQFVGMGQEIMEQYPLAAIVMNQANEILNFDLADLCFNGPAEELNNTRNTQPAIYTVSFMIYQVLIDKGIKPDVVAGHSLGEYAALAAAGVFSFADGLRLVRQRGILMDKAMPIGKGAMAAIIGLGREEIQAICEKVDGICEIANYNSPQQIVISGENAVIKKAMLLADNAGARRVIELDVSGPFHSSLMEPAQAKLAEIINQIELKTPSVSIITNTTADYVCEVEKIKSALINQLTNSVLWVDSINLMINDGFENYVEVGPGRVLKGLMRKIDRSKKVFSTQDVKSLEGLDIK